jgi:hypothetical protein
LVYCQTGSFFYAARGNRDLALNVGDEVGIVFPEEALYFFDGQDERRLSM